MTDPSASMPARASRVERWHAVGPYVALGLMLALLWSIVIGFSAMQRQRLLGETRRELGTTARAAAEQTSGVLHDAETALRVFDLSLPSGAAAVPLNDAHLAALADILRDTSRGMVDITLATRQGTLYRVPSASAAIYAELGEQPQFAALEAPGAGPLAIGEPTKLRPTGPRVLPVAMKLSVPVGEFTLGVALIDLERLGHIHRTLAREPAGAVAVARADGLILSRVPEVPGLVGRNAFDGAPERRRIVEGDLGSFETDGRLTDGTHRLVAFQRLNGLPLIVLVSQGVEAALATYVERRRIVITISAAISLLALVITWVLAGAQRHARLREAELEATVDASPLGLFRTDARGVTTYVNDTYLRIHGIERGQVRWNWPAQRSAARSAPRTITAPATAAGSAGESVAAPTEPPADAPATATDSPLETIEAYTRPDGREVMLALRTAPLRIDGRVVGQAGSVLDVTEQLAQERALHTLESIFAASTDFISQLDAEGRLTFMNPAARSRLGLSPQAALNGITFEHFHPPESVRLLREVALPIAAERGHWSGRCHAYDAARREVPVDETLLVHRGRDGRIATISAILRDVSDALEMQRQLERGEAILAAVAPDPATLVIAIDRAQRLLFINRACERALGVVRAQWTGRPLRELFGESDYRRSVPLIDAALAGARSATEKMLDARLERRCFELCFVPLVETGGAGERGNESALDDAVDATITGAVCIATDVTDATTDPIARAQRDARRSFDPAQTDALTLLPNRLGLAACADEHIERAHQDDSLLALLHLGLDHLKPVTDAHGLALGDALLKAVAGRLRNALRPQDLVARLAGDEFAVLLPELRESGDAQLIALKLVEVMAAPFLIQQHAIQVGVSVGVALARGHAVTLDGLAADAHAQLHQAQHAGHGRASGGVAP